jgi:hypothetical protein
MHRKKSTPAGLFNIVAVGGDGENVDRVFGSQ